MRFLLPGGFLKSAAPAPYVPAPVPETPTEDDAKVKKNAREKAMHTKRRAGYASNVLTSAGGAEGGATTDRKKLLGA